jgi:hypothetical protein
MADVDNGIHRYAIRQDYCRYGDIAKELPVMMIMVCKKEQAIKLANLLSACFAGCDLLFTVEGISALEHYQAAASEGKI